MKSRKTASFPWNNNSMQTASRGAQPGLAGVAVGDVGWSSISGSRPAPRYSSQDCPSAACRRVSLFLRPGSPPGFGAELCSHINKLCARELLLSRGEQKMWEPSAGVERDALCDGWAGMLSEPLSLDAPGVAHFRATTS